MLKKHIIYQPIKDELKPDLYNFIKVAKEQSLINSNCDLNKHKTWKLLFPLPPDLERELEKSTIVDLTQNEEDTVIAMQSVENSSKEAAVETSSTLLDNNNKSMITDIAYAIKENLETQKCISETFIEDLETCSVNKLNELFMLLSSFLTCEEIVNLGFSVNAVNCWQNNSVVRSYCEYLLLPKILKEYCYNFSNLLDKLYRKYPIIVQQELIKCISNQCNDFSSKIFLQNTLSLSPLHKAKLLRDFIFNCEKVEENYLDLINNLLNPQLELDTFNKLIELMSNTADDFKMDKTFGKLLINIINLLGQNAINFEQPLRNIIRIHQSILKSKLQKTFDSCLDDSVMFSQSFSTQSVV